MKAFSLCLVMMCTVWVLAAGITHSYEFTNPEFLKTDKGIHISLDGARSFGDPSEPDLPWFGYKLLLPAGSEAYEVIVKRSGEIRFSLDDIIVPVQTQYPLSHSKIEARDQPSPDIYLADKIFPYKAEKGLRTEFMNGHAIAFGTFSPFDYNPVKNELVFYPRIDVEVNYASTAKAITAMDLIKKDAFIMQRLKTSVDNVSEIPQYSFTRQNGYEYLMIIDGEKTPQWQPLVDFYTSRGISVMLKDVNQISASVAGQDLQEKIRNYIIGFYAENPLRYVLLGGDTDVIPHRGFYVNMDSSNSDNDIPADMYYSCLDGTWNTDNDSHWGEPQEADLAPELALGRICYNNDAEIANQINKIFMYQVAPVEAQIKSAGFVGEWLWDGPTWGGDYMDEMIGGSSAHGYATTGVPASWNINTLYDRTSGYSDAWGAAQIRPFLSNGYNLVNHLGHSNTTYNMRLSNNQVSATSVSNDGAAQNFSIYFTQGCYAGSFDNRNTEVGSYTQDSITEKFTSLPTSAAGMISHSRYGWGVQGSTNGASQYFHREYIDAIFGEGIHALGYTLVDSKIDNIPFITGTAVMYWVTYETNLFGCPVTSIWSDTPSTMTVNLPSAWLVGLSQYTVQTNAPNAFLKIKQDNNTLYEGYADAAGTVNINMTQALIPGNYVVYLSAANFYPSAHNIFVTSSDMPYIVCENVNTSDEDGILHTGEILDISMYIKNLGMVAQAGGGTISLSSESANIQIMQGTYSFGAMGVSDSLYVENAFQIKIVGSYADHTWATLIFNTSYDDFETHSYHRLDLSAPSLDILAYTVHNNGGYLMPGDAASISFKVHNTGSGTAFNPLMMLFSNDGMINTSVYDLSLPAVASGATLEVPNAFSFSISEAAELGTNLSVFYMLSAENGTVAEGSFNIHIGMMHFDFEQDMQDWNSIQLNQNYVNQWHRSNAKNATPGGTYSMKFGGAGSAGYSGSAYGALISPDMSLGFNSKLKFKHWMNAENHDSYPAYAWDGGNVQMSVDGGAWVLIQPVGSYPHQIYNNPASPFDTGTPVYSGSFGWTEAEFNLSAYSGQAKFRFVFGSDGYVGGEGWYVDDIRLETEPSSTGDQISIPVVLTLDQNFPNPFNPNTNISFSLPLAQAARINIYNLKGQLVKKLLDANLPAGQNLINWDGRDDNGKPVSSGIYSYRLQSGGINITRKMMLMK
ncbi:MAG: C25 family cysteine peptidase [Candidatus Cloacimonetes bacterium]|jgi:hypothetical protein|nr:C25 family cysteine peptidase [Candidatus Cloacimonadota bacterium]MDD2423029.1 C25 family cysteine peptidase [Candidatus Cloacimonadota bacterium]MDD3562102.1 C25 family cysteine peptidase [Candidatus Cloacimonadota bacterium]MDD4276433.1 C25 family cysteine peptidase [Candidatus Cloacimonadota bacterium]MDY0325300.1 C25 family cysteine peptidase [Candidatus Cloacimonadaceae bacterium]